jgi:uncharacterized protein
LVLLAEDGAYTRARSTTDQRALCAASENRAERRTACAADECALAGANATLTLLVITVIVSISIPTVMTVIVSTTSTIAHTAIELSVVAAITILSKSRKSRCKKQG